MTKNLDAQTLIKSIENKSNVNLVSKGISINIGDLIKIAYTIPEGEKERIQYYEGLVISQQNRGHNKTFTIRRTVQGVGVEQTFMHNSPKIASVIRKKASKIRRAKLYFLRSRRGKASKLKQKL